MTEGTKKKKGYDTNPLDKRVAERAEAEMEPSEPHVDTEGPTRPMHPKETAPDYPAPQTDPYRTHYTAPQSPHASQTRPQNHPNGWTAPPPGPIQQQGYVPPGQFKPLRGAAELGLKPNFAAMLCYLPFVGVIASALLNHYEPEESRFVRFHAKQSLYAHIAFWAITIAFGFARAGAPSPFGAIVAIPQNLFYFASIAGFVYMMVKSYKWELTHIPIIGDQVE